MCDNTSERSFYEKIFLWGGLIGVVVFFLLGFLAGASSNGRPILPIVYGTSGLMWAFFAIVALIFFILGLVMVIVGAAKKGK
ncbi:MAG: hypothetical protein V1826_01755 [bacterium]